MNTKGFSNPLWLVFGLVVIIGAGAGYWYTQKSDSQRENTDPVMLPVVSGGETSLTSSIANNELKELSTILSAITPTLVSATNTIATSTSAQITSHIANVLEARGEYTSGLNAPITLIAVGKRYVMYEGQALKCTGFSILDSVTGNVEKQCHYPGDFRTKDMLVLVGETEILTCKVDTPTCILLPGSQLTAGEIYGNSENLTGTFAPQLTMSHTDTSLAITTFKFDQSSTTVRGTTGTYPLKKVRELTFPLPQ